MKNFKKNKNKTRLPVFDDMDRRIENARTNNRSAFYIPIADNEIEIVRRHYSNLHIDLNFQQDGTFFYKVWGYLNEEKA